MTPQAEETGGVTRIFDRHALEVIVALGVVATALTPVYSVAETGMIVLLVSAVLLVAFRRPTTEPMARDALVAFVAGGVAVAILTLAIVRSVDPRLSFIGDAGEHNGVALWLGMFALALVAAQRARRGDLGRLARAIAVAGAIFGIAALLDYADIVGRFRYSAEPAGLLESSTSLGQLLVLGVFCAGAWALGARSAGQRMAATGAGAIIVLAMLVSHSRAAWIGVAVGAIVTLAIVVNGRKWSFVSASWAVALVLVSLGLLAASWFVLTSADTATLRQLADASNQRTTVWLSAFSSAAQHPVLGSGPEQFSAWVTWAPTQAGVETIGTFDPHNVMISWLHAAGIVGLFAAMLAAGLMLRCLLNTLQASRFSAAVAALTAAVLGWAATLMFGWVGTTVAPLLALLVGTLAVAGRDQASGEQGRGIPASAATVGAVALVLAVAVFGGPRLVAEYRWGTAMSRGLTGEIDATVQLAEDMGDPSAIALITSRVLAEARTDPSMAEALVAIADEMSPALQRHSKWHVSAAYAGFDLEAARESLLGEDSWDATEGYLVAGREADPSSGMWDYVGGVWADSLSRQADAASYAEAALRFPLGEDARLKMEALSIGGE
ncbi:MAG: O-antigen ligase family protein [Coriobacteriia bacterium]|nr:O-antigen ligase family protein [Coriobacteriia bacterium]